MIKRKTDDKSPPVKEKESTFAFGDAMSRGATAQKPYATTMNILKTPLLLSALTLILSPAAAQTPAADDGLEDVSHSSLACATTVFAQPGVRFMHKVKAASPAASVSVDGLPGGLTWNPRRSLVEGIVTQEGRYTYRITTRNDADVTTDTVSLTVSASLQHPVPFMGWISWNSVQDEVSDDIVRQVTDLFIDRGLYACGWNTVMMDDWWHAKSRAADGRPQADATRFPHGVRPLADYVHSRGMRFGLYTDEAEYTCAGAFGSYGYEHTDARQYADWGVDVVKCDYCNAPSDAATARRRYTALGDAFKASGRNIMLYICEWGVREPWKWGAEAGGTCWRVSYDVRDCWRGSTGGVGVLQSIDAMKNLSAYQGINRFNDADMLCTALHGTGKSSSDLCATGPGMTQDEYRTQFALWCMWSSPMALSFDPRSTAITDDDYAILRSTEVIAINQDRMGQQADLIDETDSVVAFAKDLENGDVALSVTNLASAPTAYTFEFAAIPHLDAAGARYLCRDLWEGRSLEPVSGSLATTVAAHATRVFRLAKTATDAATPPADLTLSAKVKKGILRVRTAGMEGLSRRILVSDTAGHILAALTTEKTAATLRLPSAVTATAGTTLVVTVTAGAQSISKNVSL